MRSRILVIPILFLVSASAWAQSDLLVFNGVFSGDNLGVAVRGIGDFDNDGTPDVLIGASQLNLPPSAPGYAIVYSGANGAPLTFFVGATIGDNFGSSLAPLGDIDHDGTLDFAIGASALSSLGSGSYVGMYSGATGLPLFPLLTAAVLGVPVGGVLSRVKDLDGDGTDDLLIGSPTATAPAGANAGAVFVVSGGTGSPLYVLYGPNAGDRFGSSLAEFGDFDADGRGDFLVGAPSTNTTTGPSTGRVYLCSGGNLGATIGTVDGSLAGHQFGNSVASAGDVDVDGVPDIIIGGISSSGVGVGYAKVISGATGGTLYQFNGDGSFSPSFGSAVAGIGDVDNDGYVDVMVAASASGYVRVFSGKTGASLYKLTSSQPSFGTIFGCSMDVVGDVDNDGFPDVIIGDKATGPFSSASKGSAEVISLVPKGISFFGTGTPGCLGPQRMSVNTVPAAGNNFFFTCNNAPPAFLGTPYSIGLAFLGDTSFPTGADPFSLGLTLYVDPSSPTYFDTADMFSDNFGYAASPSFTFPSGLTGQTFYFQTISFWPSSLCSPSTYGLSSSNAVKCVVQ